MGGTGGGAKPLLKLLGFEHLNGVSVNDFEAFYDVFKCINMHLLCIDLWYRLVRKELLFIGGEKLNQKV